MNNLTFSDGMTFDTDGDYRIEERHDGLYVVGRGLLCYVKDRQEGEQMIEMMQPAPKRHLENLDECEQPNGMGKCSECQNAMTHLWYGRPMCEEHYRPRVEKQIREDRVWRSDNDEATS